MLFLPEQAGAVQPGLEKIDTYLTLSKLGCPVFKSALIKSDEPIRGETIRALRNYFKTEEVTVRYQYVQSSIRPVQGGNRHRLSLEAIAPLQNADTYLWLLEPIDRLKNEYGINLRFQPDQCRIELVGQGFDVSDLNRGQISPHQAIVTELPVRMGAYNEWWKFLNYSFATQVEYLQSIDRRIEKLALMGYTVSRQIFCPRYKPLPMEWLETLLDYVSRISAHIDQDDFCVSASISDHHFIFWDIQTPAGKKRTYGVK